MYLLLVEPAVRRQMRLPQQARLRAEEQECQRQQRVVVQVLHMLFFL